MRTPLIRPGAGNLGVHEIYEAYAEQRNDLMRMIDTATAPDTKQDARRRGIIGARSPAGDERRLRGIPAIARGVAGAIPDTRPTDAIRSADMSDVRPTMQVGLYSGNRMKRALVQMLRARDGERCYLCRCNLDTVRVVIEHVVPLSKGGTDDAHNLALACFQCNCVKGDKIVSFLVASRRAIYR